MYDELNVDEEEDEEEEEAESGSSDDDDDSCNSFRFARTLAHVLMSGNVLFILSLSQHFCRKSVMHTTT